MMKRLFLTKVPDDFDIEKDYVLGVWCFIGKEEQYPGWENIPFLEPYKNPNDIKKASEEAKLWADSLFIKIADKLNGDLKISRKYEFWWPVLYPWLIFFSHSTLDRYLRLRKFIEWKRDEQIEVECQNLNAGYSFFDLSDFHSNGIFSAEFNEWLIGKLLKDMLPEKWTLKEFQNGAAQNNTGTDNHKHKVKLNEYIFYIFFRSYLVYGFRYLSHILFSLLLYFKKSKSNDFTYPFEPVIAKERLSSVPRIIQEIVESVIPWSYRNVVTNPFYKISILFFPGKFRMYGPQYIFNENLKIVIGRCWEAGEKIITTQHGGSYGNSLVHPISTDIEYRFNYFFSWGYANDEKTTGKIIPVPSPYLSKKKFRYANKNENIVFVGTSMRLFAQRIESGPIAFQWAQYRKDKIIFIKNMDMNLRQNFIYRPYINEMGCLREKTFVLDQFPDIKIIDSDLHKEIMGCRLLILDHPGTTMNIALSANVPTICYWNKRNWAMTPQSQEYFDKLENAKILFYDPELAARHANDIFFNINNWWNSDLVQDARKQWAFQYARTNGAWWIDWIKAIRNL